MERLEQYCGRLLTADQLPAVYYELAQKMPAMTKRSGHFFCNRCAGQIENTHRLPDGSFYCRACLVFGRLTSKDSLYWLEQKAFPAQQALLGGAINRFSAGGIRCAVGGYSGKNGFVGSRRNRCW